MSDASSEELPFLSDEGERPPEDVTSLLKTARTNSPDAERKIISHIYTELQQIARRHLAHERAGHTLSTTGLVHEAYLKLIDLEQVSLQDRRHFIALASKAIRWILTDHARARSRLKRGGNAVHVPLEDASPPESPRSEQLIALDEALTALERYDPRLARLVELRFFGGMTMQEAADELEFALRSAERAWTRARAFLLAYMNDDLSLD